MVDKDWPNGLYPIVPALEVHREIGPCLDFPLKKRRAPMQLPQDLCHNQPDKQNHA